MRTLPALPLSLLLAACSATAPETRPDAPLAGAGTARIASHDVALPGGGPDGVGMDFLAYDPATSTVWAPAGNTGAVVVLDTRSGKLSTVDGFPTTEIERRGKKRKVGPSSVSIGEGGTVYVGNRGDSSICAVDAGKLARGACGKVDAMPDATVWVAATREVWVTTPRDKSIRILDGATLAQKSKVAFDGEPEGYAIDGARGVFYTNLEDKDLTLAVDLQSHAVKSTWKAGCGEEGPHGLALDGSGRFLMVACSTRVEVLDTAHDGAVLSSVDTGDGVDLIDYQPATRTLTVGAAKAARLTFARLDEGGKLSVAATVATKPGARNGVADGAGNIYLAHAQGSELIVVPPAGGPK